MNRSKSRQVKAGMLVISLILVGLIFQPASGQGVEQNNNEGIGNSLVYLPVLRRPFPFAMNLISVASDGTQGNNESARPTISIDGRYVVFSSEANNLIIGDTNGEEDVFVYDRQTRRTTRISVASDGTQGNNWSGYFSRSVISMDGRYVAFYSSADNLVSGDVNGHPDVFIHDRQTAQTTLISVASDGTKGNNVSARPTISADGRYVAFSSFADNLVSGDTNSVTDVFVHDRQTGETTRISSASNGTQSNNFSYGPSISADGRYVAFESSATNLISNDTNSSFDIFVHDRQTGQTNRVSVASDGTQGNSWSRDVFISADGRYVSFESKANNLVSGDTNEKEDIFVYDRQTGQTSRVSVGSDGAQGNGESWDSSISANGRYIAFESTSDNWMPIYTWSIFVYDQQTGQLSLVSLNLQGLPSYNPSSASSISEDGRYVAFMSYASDLVSGDTNGYADVFVYDRGE